MERIIVIELLAVIVLLFGLCLLQIKRAKAFGGQIYVAVKTLIKRGAIGLVYYALWLVPRDKKLIVFTSDEGNGFSGNPKYLFLEMQKHPEYRKVWLTKNVNVYNSLKSKGYEVYMCFSRKGLWTQLRAGTLIHSNSLKEEFSYLCAAGATSVNCWHGVGLKRVWFRNKNAFSGQWMAAPPSLRRSYHLWWARLNKARKNYLIGTSEEVNAYYPATYDVPAECVLNLGQARNDVFFDDSLEEGRLPDCFKNGKVIVYMPTYRKYSKKSRGKEGVGKLIDYDKLSAVLEKYGYTLVVKQHRFNTAERPRHNSYKNIVDISALNYDLDSQLLLKYTDILITDYSSCYTDFLLLNRPVVFYCYDLDQYLSSWELNFDYDYVTPGPKVFDSDELIDALEKLMRGEDEYAQERERVKRVFYSPENQGPVTKKQVDYILEHIIGA